MYLLCHFEGIWALGESLFHLVQCPPHGPDVILHLVWIHATHWAIHPLAAGREGEREGGKEEGEKEGRRRERMKEGARGMEKKGEVRKEGGRERDKGGGREGKRNKEGKDERVRKEGR